jgi:beta-glucosidase
MSFPDGFMWGASTAAQQIEGAVAEGGRGPSVWDVFARRPGAVHLGQNADTACSHYHRWKEDIGLMQDIGLKAYRFSVAWPRILPEGTGPTNEAGLAFYDQLVDGLLKAGIEPFLTLYHWDMPQALADRGGWLNPDSPAWFADYAGIVASRLGDRVKWWSTFNEQAPFLVGGYHEGWHAPGFKCGYREFLLACKHVMLAHGDAVRRVRQAAPSAKLGMAPVGICGIPRDETPSCIEAARNYTFGLRAGSNWQAPLFTEGPLLGCLPPNFHTVFPEAPAFSDDDLARMSPRLDFLGVNFYNAPTIGEDGNEAPSEPGWPPEGSYWKLTPEGLYWSVKFYFERYGLPIVVTENGITGQDWVALDGHIHDAPRIDALHRYLLSLRRAVDEGVPVNGYFHWSLLDNFEWAEGYKQRFGLVHVDFRTLKRTMKDSASWYREVIRSNGANL